MQLKTNLTNQKQTRYKANRIWIPITDHTAIPNTMWLMGSSELSQAAAAVSLCGPSVGPSSWPPIYGWKLFLLYIGNVVSAPALTHRDLSHEPHGLEGPIRLGEGCFCPHHSLPVKGGGVFHLSPLSSLAKLCALDDCPLEAAPSVSQVKVEAFFTHIPHIHTPFLDRLLPQRCFQ